MSEIGALQDQDDTQGHRFGDVGETAVEGGRRPMAAGDEDDVQGHKHARAIDDGDVEGHKHAR